MLAPYQADGFQRVSGGIILAPEGINGSICGTRDSVERVLEFIKSDDRLKGLRQMESPVSAEDEAIHHGHASSSPLAAGEDAPFRWDHVRVKLKKEVLLYEPNNFHFGMRIMIRGCESLRVIGRLFLFNFILFMPM